MFGCGYPGDSLTKAWLKTSFDPVFGFPTLVRFSWSTARKLLVKDSKELAYWFDLFDEEKKNGKQAKDKQQATLVVKKTPGLTARKIKPFFSTKLQLKRGGLDSL